MLTPVEIAWLPRFGDGRLDGSYKIGAWYSSSPANDVASDVNGNMAVLSGLPPMQRPGRYGAYLAFQQQVTRDADNPDGGLRLFLNAALADGATATTDHQVALGGWYTGPFRGRPSDVIGFAIGTTHVNNRVVDAATLQNAMGLGPVPVKTAEYVLELDYTFVPVQGFFLRPNVQYIYSPGGSAATRDVWVLGLKTVVNF